MFCFSQVSAIRRLANSSLGRFWRCRSKCLHALTPQKRGPKSKRSALGEEDQKLRRENQHLSEELRKAEIVIDIQKKVAALLGRPICTPEREPKP